MYIDTNKFHDIKFYNHNHKQVFFDCCMLLDYAFSGISPVHVVVVIVVNVTSVQLS